MPSRILAVFLVATHAAALVVVYATPLIWYWRAGFTAVVLVALAYELGVHVLYLLPHAVREATWNPDGSWSLVLVSGSRTACRLLPSTFLTQRLLVLNFRCGRWRSRTMVLLSDALDPDLLRRLRVRLRLTGGEKGQGAGAAA